MATHGPQFWLKSYDFELKQTDGDKGKCANMLYGWHHFRFASWINRLDTAYTETNRRTYDSNEQWQMTLLKDQNGEFMK